MNAYEFSTHVAPNGTVVIPKNYLKKIPTDGSVRVILLVEAPGNGDYSKQNNGIGQGETKSPEIMSLEEFVAHLQKLPIEQSSIIPESGLLAEHLAHSVSEPASDLVPEEWDRQWAQMEAEWKEVERLNETNTLEQMTKQLA